MLKLKKHFNNYIMLLNTELFGHEFVLIVVVYVVIAEMITFNKLNFLYIYRERESTIFLYSFAYIYFKNVIFRNYYNSKVCLSWFFV